MGYPIYEPKKWNTNKCIIKSHNCYMYALNKIDRKIVNDCKNTLSPKDFKNWINLKPYLKSLGMSLT